MILYEHIYEIYGDIVAGTNCFKIDAYEQGRCVCECVCMCVSVYVCLSLQWNLSLSGHFYLSQMPH